MDTSEDVLVVILSTFLAIFLVISVDEFNPEFRKLVSIFLPLGLGLADVPAKLARLDFFEHGGKRLLGALSQDLDVAVRQVPDPSGDARFVGDGLRRVTETDPLHAPLEQGVQTLFLGCFFGFFG